MPLRYLSTVIAVLAFESAGLGGTAWAQADLAPTALTPPASVVAGSSMSVPTTVQN